MGFEITTNATVGPNGHLEVDPPELTEGQTVQLVIRTKQDEPPDRSRLFGSMKGELLYMSDDFDDPLPEFADYQ